MCKVKTLYSIDNKYSIFIFQHMSHAQASLNNSQEHDYYSSNAPNNYSFHAQNNQISKDEERKINKMFDIMQVPIMNYIVNLAKFIPECTNGSYDTIFNKNVNYKILLEEPIILGNLDKLESMCVMISFRISDHLDAINNFGSNLFSPDAKGPVIGTFVNHKLDDVMFDYVAKFILDSTSMVFNYIVDQFIDDPVNKEFFSSLHFELDVRNMTLFPIAISLPRRKYFALQELLQNLNDKKNTSLEKNGPTLYEQFSPGDKIAIEEAEEKIKHDMELSYKLCTQEDEDRFKNLTNRLLSYRIVMDYDEINENEIHNYLTSAEPTPAEPTPAELTPIESTSAEPTPAEPTPAELTPVESTSAELTPVESTSAEPTPAEPTPAELT